jgi:Spy/CpxP family protein refolding chaperone
MRLPAKFWFLTLVGLATATYAFAQPKQGPSAPAHEHKHEGKCAGCEKGCPMHAIGELADVKVENTAKGATVTFTAKKPEDAKKVQDVAKQIAERTGCDCCKPGGGECKLDGSGKCEKCEHHGDKHEGHKGHAH